MYLGRSLIEKLCEIFEFSGICDVEVQCHTLDVVPGLILICHVYLVAWELAGIDLNLILMDIGIEDPIWLEVTFTPALGLCPEFVNRILVNWHSGRFTLLELF